RFGRLAASTTHFCVPTLRWLEETPALGFQLPGNLPNTTYAPPNWPDSGGRVPVVAGGWGLNPLPVTVMVSPAGEMPDDLETVTVGVGAKESGVNVSNAGYD